MQNQSSKTLLVIGFAIAFALSNVMAGESFKATGHLEVTAFDQNGEKYSNHHSDFQINVNGNQWEMVSTQGTGHVIRVGSDGNAVYAVMSYPPSMPLPLHSAPPATIDLGFYYLSGTPYENVVWYALASSGLTNEFFPAPWLDSRKDPTASIYVAKTDARLDSGLPAKVRFYVSENLIKISGTNENLFVESQSPVTEHFKSVLDAYKDNFLAADYDVLDTTNVGGITIPIHFILRRYSPDYSIDKIFEIFEGTVSNFNQSKNTNFVPENIGIVGVSDYRLKDIKDRIDGVRYFASNQWVGLDDSNLVALYKKRLERQPQPLYGSIDDKDKKKLPIIVLIAIVFILPPIFMLKKWLMEK